MFLKKILLLFFTCLAVLNSFGNTPPKAVNDTVAICKNSAFDSIFVLKNDKDVNNDSIFIKQIVNNPSNGVATSDGKTIIYTPTTNFKGSDVIYIQICDNGTPSLCAYSFVLITVDTCYPKNNAPLAKNDSLSACKNRVNELGLLYNDIDPDNDSIFIKKIWKKSKNGIDSLTADGRFFYKPTLGFIGKDSLTYIICDVPKNNQKSLCDTAVSFIHVKLCTGTVNNAPTATIDIVPGIEDFGGLPFDPRSNDTDPDGDPLTWNALFGPTSGTIVQFGAQWRYIPNKDFNGIDIMPYRVCDNGTPQRCAFSVVTFIILAQNDPPVAKDDSFSVFEDGSAIFPVTQNDIDVDRDILSVNITFSPAHGTIQVINGNQVLYTPNPNYIGQDGFSYEACDSTRCSSAFVKITVLPFNDLPVALNDSVFFEEGQSTKDVSVLVNDSDEEGDPFVLTNAWSIGNNYMVNIVDRDGKQQLEIMKMSESYCGDDSVFYEICADNGCAIAVVYIHAKCKFDSLLPEGISPNGDGKNDFLVFPFDKDSHPYELRIYNRYGSPVYVSEDYQNDWDGTSFDTKQALPDGSYWYTVELPTGKKFVSFCVLQR